MNGSQYIAEFHDGHIVAVTHRGPETQVKVRGASGKLYLVHFEGVIEIESESPEGMTLYGVRRDEDENRNFYVDFINWYVNEPEEPRAKSLLKIRAAQMKITDLEAEESKDDFLSIDS
jgi:hypothetical protein